VPNGKIGNAFRASVLVKGTKEALGEVVVARYAVNPIKLIERVKAKTRMIAAGLPPDVKIILFYDRSALIQQAVDALGCVLNEEAVIRLHGTRGECFPPGGGPGGSAVSS